MKTLVCYVFCFLFFGACAFSEEDPPADTRRSLTDTVFVVETDESSVSDSLNRISGDIDLGFSAPSQSYESSGHYRPGPFGRTALEDDRS